MTPQPCTDRCTVEAIIRRGQAGGRVFGPDRDGVCRLNFAVGRRECEHLMGLAPADADRHRGDDDPAAIGVPMLHPTYASHGWVSLVCSGEIPSEPATTLLRFADDRAAPRHRSRAARHRG